METTQDQTSIFLVMFVIGDGSKSRDIPVRAFATEALASVFSTTAQIHFAYEMGKRHCVEFLMNEWRCSNLREGDFMTEKKRVMKLLQCDNTVPFDNYESNWYVYTKEVPFCPGK